MPRKTYGSKSETMKEFNITGSCFPDQHYMVDIGKRLERVKAMVDDGKYFCINRGRQYVIEMKIWRGESYSQRGEKQFADYLDYFKFDTGYMVSFCFNQNKVPGLKAPIQVGTRTLVEVVV